MKDWRLEIVLLLILLAAGALWQIHQHPLHKPRPEPEQGAVDPAPLPQSAGSPYVLLLDRAVVDQPGPPAQRDWSYAWVNWLEQECGAYRIIDPARLGTPAEPARGIQLAIVSRSAWGGLGASGRAALQEIVGSGGAVIAESPPPGTPLPEPAERVVLLDEPFAASLVRLQQGWVDPGQPLPPAPPGVPADMICTHQLGSGGRGEVLVPAADHLERELSARVEAITPLVRWWPFPDAAAGVVAVTYEEPGVEERGTWMARHDWSRGVASTLYLSPLGQARTGAKQSAGRAGVELGLGWARGFLDLAPRIRWGLGPFTFFWRRASLVEQLRLLRSLSPGVEFLPYTRSLGGVWDPEFGKSFRIVAAAGMTVDSSYGPADEERAGYLFGTGLPFHPMDANGRPFELLEVPYVFRNTGRYDRSLQARLVKASAAGDHQLLVGRFDVRFMAENPSVERMEAWLALPQLATAHDHRLMSLGAYLAHWRARLSSPLATRWEEQTGQLTVWLTAAQDGLTLTLPGKTAGRTLARVKLDGEVLPPERLARRNPLLLLPLTAGEHELEIVYPPTGSVGPFPIP